ncbi:MAG: T9SS type A sorting domain-containing protein [Chitinophagales bacterium]|nr:T9SS type A sorting domain-containing protein [Chitinophagales bacterium]
MRFFFSFFLLLLLLHCNAQVFDITTYGAVGNGTTLNTTAIQAAIDACHAAGGGTVEVPSGNFLTGTLILKSNVNFHISQGGTITGSTNINHYPVLNPQKRTYTDNYPQRSVFYAEGQHNIAVTGEGTFHGNGQSVAFLLDQANRPYGFRFFSCSNVRYEGLTLRHSGFWMMHNFDIDTLVIKNLNIVNHGFGNNDGVNIDCSRKVLVDSIFADCNDDPMVIKTSSLLSSEDIEIKNCTVATYSRALKIGTETNGAVKNVHLHDCVVQLSTLGPLNNKASCGINLSIVDGGSMENVLVENVTMTGINTPFFIRLGNRARKYTDTAATQGVGYVRNIELKSITATASNNITSSVTGIPNYYAKNIALKNIDVTFPGGYPVSNGLTVPEKENGKPDADMFGDTLPAAGLYIRHVDSVRLENVCFHPQQYDQRPTLYFDDVLNADTTGVCLETSMLNHTAEKFKIYPNPLLHQTLQFEKEEGETVKVIINNFSGKVFLETIVSETHTAFDVTHLPKGIYLFTVTGKRITTSKKFVKLGD